MKKLKTIMGMALLFLIPLLSRSQNTRSLQVLETNGQPVAGATILLNKQRALVADAQGRVSISELPNSVITISSVGFKSRTIKTDTLKQNTIYLLKDVANLDEVVVTGLATSVKRSNLANAVTTISAKELNETAPAQTFDQALEGKIPGAYINANTGAPGGGVTVKLRGITSVYGQTQPLYVVDGVFLDNSSTSAGLNAVTNAATGGSPTSTQDNPSSRIADLNPEDIQSIEILKGASAAAIYGSRAASGVVIITTKKGRAGKTTINFSQDVGIITARKLLGVREFTADRAASLSRDSATSEALKQQFLDAQSAGHIYDYEKEIYGNKGFARNSDLSLTGGNEQTTFFFSASQKNEEGIVKRTGYNNTAFRLNVEHRINDRIKLGMTTNYINSSADRGLFGNDNVGVTTGIALSSTPSFAELHPDANGNYPNNPFASANPLQTIALMINNESVNRFIGGLNLEATLQTNIKSTTKLIARGGFDFYNLQTTALFPGVLQWQTINKGTSIQGFTKNLNSNYIASLVNSFTPSEKLSFTTSAGLTQETGDYNNLLNVATQIIAGQSNVNEAGALNATQFRNKYLNTGIFAQEEALIMDAITLTAGVRFDRSSNNGDVSKFYTYPKAGVSWNLTKSGILRNAFFNSLKLRAAYGEANNVPVYGSKFTGMVISNISGNPGVIVSTQQGDASIKPERQKELETGIDFSVLNNRLGFELTYYNKSTDDFLMLQSLPSSSGFSSKWVNAGDLRNRGVELSMNALPIENRNVTWNTSVNFWLNRSEVTRLTIPPIPQGSFGYVLGSFQIEQGKSATQIVGLNGSGVGVLGDAEPKFQMSTYNEITFFRKLSLRFLLHWKQGGDNINLTSLENDFGGTSVDYDKVTNKMGVPDAIYRIMQIGSSARIFVQDASYLRLREVGLYYSFDKIPGNVVKNVRVGVSLNNYLTITKYKSYDPEVSNFGFGSTQQGLSSGLSTGVDVDPYPASKRADLHISISF
ncbi:MAG TPA: SusC/RagA family TonB-linked outer membrane protein [Hanamia sp.]|nr:SusC/RagA family TonB-linked outer membrane protein [Hanamia sp.]